MITRRCEILRFAQDDEIEVDRELDLLGYLVRTLGPFSYFIIFNIYGPVFF
jgi:hypothetical protein